MKKTYRSSGLSLIELLVVLAIAAILAAIAAPNYISYTNRGSRADAMVLLLQNAQFMEQNFTESTDYSVDVNGTAIGQVLPYQQAPVSGTKNYDIGVSATATTFTLTATPTGSMAGDECGNLTLNHLGQKGVSGTLSVDECWNN